MARDWVGWESLPGRETRPGRQRANEKYTYNICIVSLVETVPERYFVFAILNIVTSASVVDQSIEAAAPALDSFCGVLDQLVAGEVDDQGFHGISHSRALVQDILHSLCGFPLIKTCQHQCHSLTGLSWTGKEDIPQSPCPQKYMVPVLFGLQDLLDSFIADATITSSN